ncbi:hypothetical protein L202_06837 [Cryptococcus amylolentus CBS 6039]|uniref:Endopeptidase S2P n=2 Tax=Cryptococcus amylolentus TaxID=104669 RepID=A0A1E3HDN6_9TREE|nr:hypothetical protein L202_06837 [Cryptococcus amylolentus CBS 6039]ODN74444.1 hypothetical protein L202_06837 [Cryptococcus amylolentus CBS 6039]ODO01442.1 hypothetical protein I350_06262 [Cryptococcus amylolentus CBS 6273]
MLSAISLVPSALLALLLYAVYKLTILLPSAAPFTSLPVHRPLSGPATDATNKDTLLPPPPLKGQWIVAAEPPWTFSLSTSALNPVPSLVLSFLKFRNSQRLKKLYDFSIALGLVGMVAGMTGAGYAGRAVWTEVWTEFEGHVGVAEGGAVVEGVGMAKRSVDLILPSGETQAGSGGGLQPLIPGITMPLSHLPALLLALVFNQLVHELGHALSAALDDVQPSKLSLTLSYFVPSMAVEFGSSIDNLDPNAKMRIAISGPVHNLITWLTLWLLAFSGLTSMFWIDRSYQGAIVQDILWTSPLSQHFKPDEVITHLNDIPLSRSALVSPTEKWASYLASDTADDTTRGWCVNAVSFLSLPPLPCNASTKGWREGSIAFITNEFDDADAKKEEEKCLAPHPILDIPSKGCPCPDHRWVCVRPKSEEILRIRVRGSWGRERVVLWDGDREEVLRHVRVGKESGRWWTGGVRAGALLFKYIKTIAFSLFIFNLLPLPYTDGSQLLSSLLQWHPAPRPLTTRTLQATLSSSKPLTEKSNKIGAEAEEFELGSDEEDQVGLSDVASMRAGMGARKSPLWRRRLKMAVQGYMVVVCVVWVLGWGMLLLLRSS